MTTETKVPISGLAAVSASLLNTGRYADLTIKCQGRIFKVHRAVVNPQSAPFAACVDGGFKEGTTSEIDLPDDDPKIISHLIQFFYTGDFNDAPASSDVLADGRLTTCTKVYIIADKYDVPGLRKLATTKFQTAIASDWNTDSLATCIELIYKGIPDSDRTLKEIALRATSEHIKELVDRGEFVSMCKSDGEITFDILCESLPSLSGKTPGQCPKYKGDHRHNIRWDVVSQQFYCDACPRYFR